MDLIVRRYYNIPNKGYATKHIFKNDNKNILENSFLYTHKPYMRKFTTLLLWLIITQSLNAQLKVSSSLSLQYNKTIYDATSGNNPSGIGLGLETIFTTKTKCKPAIEITADIYLEDDKVFRMINGQEQEGVGGMINLFAGALFNPNQNAFLSFYAGPSFINGNTLLGIKPSFGSYFSKSQRWKIKMSYINIFNRDKQTKKDFGTISFAIALKLF